jgi:sugar-specific transcriptional regulator TrmB
MDSLSKKLEKIGLSEKEAVVYAFLLGVPGAYPSVIAEKTHLNRSTVYKVLISLSVKGLVSEIEKGKKLYYQTESPKKLKTFTKYRLEQAELASDYAADLSPVLESIFEGASGRPKVTYYEGKEAVVGAYLRHVQVEGAYNMSAFVNAQDIKRFLPEKSFTFYKKEKERIGIRARGITSLSSANVEFQKDTHSNIKKAIWPELRFVPESLFTFPGEITMFDRNKVSIIKFDATNPIGVIIEDKVVHDMMQAIFELVWMRAKEMPKKQITKPKA